MPCDSRITETKMIDSSRLVKALTECGWNIVKENDTFVSAIRGTERIYFSRYKAGTNFFTEEDASEIQRKYSELSVRSWATRSNFNVTSFDGKKMVLVNRRT